MVTRDESPKGGRLGAAIRALGHPALHWSAMALQPPEDPSALQELAAAPEKWSWVVFTSRRAVASVAAALEEAGHVWPTGWRIAVVGEKTATAVDDVGGHVELLSQGTGEELARALAEHLPAGGATLVFPTTPRAADTLPELLEEAGHRVHRVDAYRTELAALDERACAEAIEGGRVGVVTFTSPSAVAGLEDALPTTVLEPLKNGCPGVVIGPTTGAAARRAGWHVRQADTTSLEAVAEAAASLLDRDMDR